jgi:Rrf2 family protein
MIYSRSAGYAIRALVFMAGKPEGSFLMAKQIASQLEIPGHFLAKLLQQLTRQGLLKSSKGPAGGFALKKTAAELSLSQIVAAVDGPPEEDVSPLEAHEGWRALREGITGYLEHTSIEEIASAVEDQRAALAKGRKRAAKRAAKQAS